MTIKQLLILMVSTKTKKNKITLIIKLEFSNFTESENAN